MLGLFFLGQEVERHYGSKLFLRMYLTALIVCSLAWGVTEVVLGPSEFLVDRRVRCRDGGDPVVRLEFSPPHDPVHDVHSHAGLGLGRDLGVL